MAGDVVGIEAARSHPDQQPHAVEEVWCLECGRHHVSVRPLACPLECCECPCGKVGTLEVLTRHEAHVHAQLASLGAQLEELREHLGDTMRRLEALGGSHG